ncbi:hypothetical protein HPG69_005721 [Diceros bicornis minor]|uniref:G-protein coupled receptors family 1 profile domain-containing protein n=1 Tax=Diceros bicornis minor TaxID=77932 RepID=A0A7J7ES83_DICBM|nr:hypothetical protein HPG69_005721 [Diceros bicornis minor]
MSKSPDSRHKKMFNSSQFTQKYFLLTGLPGLEALYPCFIFLLCFTYLVAIVGNSLILTVIKKNTSLHQPMYLLLAMLAFAELGVSASTLSTVMGIFLFGAILVFYVPMICMALVHRFMKHAAPALRLLLANVCFLVPPVLNSIIYSIKTKQIHQEIIQLFLERKC